VKKPNYAKEVTELLRRRLHPDLMPNPDAVRAAKQLLEMAKSGEVVELVAVTLHRDGATGHVYANRPGYAYLSMATVGAMAVRHTQICNGWGAPIEPPEEED
jgi:hypothetical protein